MAAHSSTKHFVWQELIFGVQTIGERFLRAHGKLKRRDSDASDFATFSFGNGLRRKLLQTDCAPGSAGLLIHVAARHVTARHIAVHAAAAVMATMTAMTFFTAVMTLHAAAAHVIARHVSTGHVAAAHVAVRHVAVLREDECAEAHHERQNKCKFFHDDLFSRSCKGFGKASTFYAKSRRESIVYCYIPLLHIYKEGAPFASSYLNYLRR